MYITLSEISKEYKMFEKIDLYKNELGKKRPFRDTVLLNELKSFYRVGLTYASNALEGNSLTLS
jgi:hypothetical protein